MLEMVYQLPYPPTVNHIYSRTKKGGVMLNSKAREYREEVIQHIGKGHTTITGRIALHIDAYMPDRRLRDLSNILKALEDAMTHAGVWKDDSQIYHLIVFRRGIQKPGRVLVRVSQIIEEKIDD